MHLFASAEHIGSSWSHLLNALFVYREVWQRTWYSCCVSNSLLHWLEAWQVTGNVTKKI